MRLACLIVCGVAIAGCGIDEGGTPSPTDGGLPDVLFDSPISPDAIGVDVLGDAPAADAGPCTTPASACGGALAGWKPVAFVENPSSACPTGWTTRVGLDKPVAGATACGCSCTPANPTCDGADLATNITNMANCGDGSKTLPMASSTCKSIGNTNIDNNIKVTPTPPTGGGCAVVAKASGADLTATPVRECDPTPACEGDLCAGIAPTTYLACVEKSGDQATCPAGFPNRFLVGDSVDPQCGNGTCACGAKASCGAATLTLYSDTACATKVIDTPADNKCNASNAGGTSFKSYKYNTTPGTLCAATGAAAASPVLITTLRTACCK